jgi:hypothetical protein
MLDLINQQLTLESLVREHAPGLETSDERAAAWVFSVGAIRNATTIRELARSWAMINALRTLLCADSQRVLVGLACEQLAKLNKKPPIKINRKRK